MSDKGMIIKPLAAAIGVAFVTSISISIAISSTALAADNPFAAADLDSGYLLAGDEAGTEGKCGEGKCGENKDGEGKCGEGKCGASPAEEDSDNG